MPNALHPLASLSLRKIVQHGRILAAIVVASYAAACAAPSTRIADGLGRYGIPPDQAHCVGDRLQARLSLGQLRQLGNAAHSFGESAPGTGQLTPGDFIRASSRISDPQVPVEVAKAAAACGLLTSTLFPGAR